MASLVLELQQDALNPRVEVSDILRKALVVARKLGLHELEQWMQSELNGYGDTQTKQIPEYRQIRGQVRAFNPYRGWQPVVFEDVKMERLVSTKSCSQSAAEIEHLLSSAKGGGTLTMEFTGSQQVELARAIHADLETTLMIEPANLARILDAVRNTILEWTLKLEQDGIRGEGMSFTPEEKRRVANHGSYNINIFGSVHGSQIQQATDSSVQHWHRSPGAQRIRCGGARTSRYSPAWSRAESRAGRRDRDRRDSASIAKAEGHSTARSSPFHPGPTGRHRKQHDRH